jgi:hypothetical protein
MCVCVWVCLCVCGCVCVCLCGWVGGWVGGWLGGWVGWVVGWVCVCVFLRDDQLFVLPRFSSNFSESHSVRRSMLCFSLVTIFFSLSEGLQRAPHSHSLSSFSSLFCFVYSAALHHHPLICSIFCFVHTLVAIFRFGSVVDTATLRPPGPPPALPHPAPPPATHTHAHQANGYSLSSNCTLCNVGGVEVTLSLYLSPCMYSDSSILFQFVRIEFD